LINAIPELAPRAVIDSFLSHYLNTLAIKKSFIGFSAAARLYTELLFPGIPKGMNHFGTLKRDRAHVSKIVREFFTLKPLKDVCLKRTPVLCLYAKKDPVLNIYDACPGSDYQDNMRRLCPQALFRPLDGDHFLSEYDARSEAARSITSFLGSM